MPLTSFYAYPEEPLEVAATIDKAAALVHQRLGPTALQTWRETDIAERFIADQILARIGSVDVLFADITQLNFNVAYEVGFGRVKGSASS